MNYVKFKETVATQDQIRLLMRAASTFGAPVITKKVSETEAYYSVAYTHRGEERTLVLKLSGEDNRLMIDCLALAKRNES